MVISLDKPRLINVIHESSFPGRAVQQGKKEQGRDVEVANPHRARGYTDGSSPCAWRQNYPLTALCVAFTLASSEGAGWMPLQLGIMCGALRAWGSHSGLPPRHRLLPFDPFPRTRRSACFPPPDLRGSSHRDSAWNTSRSFTLRGAGEKGKADAWSGAPFRDQRKGVCRSFLLPFVPHGPRVRCA